MEENDEQISNLLLYNDKLREEIVFFDGSYKFNKYDEENEY